ncbi:CpaD family pilus assembly protein [Sphingomonas sp.]|jgi:pilus assembly protein CpaD|uniref:CpaD family pilus assembly protein n=1 Tax=Sphingomonas sp. TaxID=28214 RepID=UPI002ED966CD
MNKSLLLLAALPALAVGGCMGTQNRGLETVHQPVVERKDYALDLATRGSNLAPGEAKRLEGWFGSLRLGYGDHVAIDDAGYGAAHADVGAVVTRSGLLLSNDTPVTGAPIAPGTVRVVVSRMKASVPGCPDYSRDSAHEFDSNTSSNYGCAINSNIAAMIADPGDLVRGQASATGTDPRVSFRAIDAYRKAAPSGGGGGAVQAAGVGGK